MLRPVEFLAILAVIRPSAGFSTHARPVVHVRPATVAIRHVPIAVEAESPLPNALQPRPPYVLTALPRPQWRGKMMGWLHSTRAWYFTAVAYVFVAWRIPASGRLGGFDLALRAVAAAASSANVFISDGYHNGDCRGGSAYTSDAELVWLRWDYVGISCVLTSLLWLWSSNFAWVGQLPACGIIGGISTALVALIARTVVPRKLGHNIVKGLMAFQFAGLLLYLVMRVGPSINTALFYIYAPGLVLYVLKKPQSPIFGFHEYFHSSVIAGHVLSIFLDLRHLALL